MVGVWKRIRGDRGETRVGPLLRLPLRVERGGGRTVLAYEPPLSALVDEISPRAGTSGTGGDARRPARRAISYGQDRVPRTHATERTRHHRR
jgi:hypothetical protein